MAMPQREESDLAFYSRRAMEESRAAARTGSRRASSAHRHMSVAYAVRMRDEELAANAFVEMLALLDDGDAAAGDDDIAANGVVDDTAANRIAEDGASVQDLC